MSAITPLVKTPPYFGLCTVGIVGKVVTGSAVVGGAVLGDIIVVAGVQPSGREAEMRTVKNKNNSFLICFPPTQNLDKFSVSCCL